jgi:hypothetical protein
MSRLVLRPVLDVVLTVAVALAGLIIWQVLVGGGPAEGVRVLFNFMDVGLILWAILLVVLSVRARARGGVTAGRVFLVLLIATVVNAIVVLVVGFVQGGWGPLLVLFAIQAGIACLLAGAVVIPLVHRLLRSGIVPRLRRDRAHDFPG